MQVDADPLQTEDAHYAESVEILMVEATDDFDMDVKKADHISAVADVEMQLVYPQAEEGPVDFLERCKLSDSKTMLCPRCSTFFEEEAAKKLEDIGMQDSRMSKGWN